MGTNCRTIPEVARELRVSTPTAWRLKAQGQLPYHQVGRRILVTDSDFSEFLARTAVPAKGP